MSLAGRETAGAISSQRTSGGRWRERPWPEETINVELDGPRVLWFTRKQLPVCLACKEGKVTMWL